ncbi:MAG: biopolymer transporter ExbD [Bacteroidetes bacterium]|nr:biopolymer transporter ExbD [Bacteroidota bacterium]
MARPVQEINAGSMADIAFLLLIFFLVTTTMDVDTGIVRKLPPPIDPTVKPPEIKERNVFVVLINAYDQLLVEGQLGNIYSLREKTKEFVKNPYNKSNLSESKEVVIEGLGPVNVSDGVVSLQNDRGTSYEMYIKVQNELASAFNELRDELAKDKFGTSYSKLIDNKDEAKLKAIKDAIPMQISEAEPKDIGGGK